MYNAINMMYDSINYNNIAFACSVGKNANSKNVQPYITAYFWKRTI